MKKLNKLTHLFILMLFSAGLLTSCGTEEEVGDASLELSLSSNSVNVGESISFQLFSSFEGDVTDAASFFVNGVEISGNSYVPGEANSSNEVYGIYDGKQSAVKTFASIEQVPSEYTRKVLLEDYTGTWCGYCPRMVSIVNYLTEYNDRIIPIAIHCQGAPSDPWTYEFWADMASPQNYNAMGAPKGKYNRIHSLNQYEGTHPCPNDPTIYYSQADEFLNESANLGLAISSNLNGNNLKMTVKVGFATDSVPDARLVVTLIEDGLKHNQVNYYAGSGLNCDSNYNYSSMPNPIPNFAQEHVLLKAYTDIYGDVIPQSEISNGNVYSRDFNVQLPSNVGNPANLKIVAFVLGNGNSIPTRGVLNAQRADVGSSQDFD